MIGDILQPTHLLLILLVALLVLGPKRLPEVGRMLGKGLRDFRHAISLDDNEREAFAMPALDAEHYTATPVQPTPPDTAAAPATATMPAVTVPAPEASGPTATVPAPEAPAARAHEASAATATHPSPPAPVPAVEPPTERLDTSD